MAKQHINPQDLTRASRYGSYEAWGVTTGNYAEVRGSNGIVIQRYRGEHAKEQADSKAKVLGNLLHV